eukprot:TRINITY_DN121528_c0_g1_i1.p1 TRINITY_DN121528_c0_g1~~TRINITY_DN121528_c0_g1_i1.p1  ORF type:complete len:711 (+),score=128.55 TRINITY_DN121528_c0_g1_i1:264-2135(+)
MGSSYVALGALPGAMMGVAIAQRQRRARTALRGKKRGGRGGYQRKGGPPPAEEKVSKVSEGAAYAQETRQIILSLDSIDKNAMDGTAILKDVSLGMYRGAKIGILGANGAGKSTVMRILAGKDKDFAGELVKKPNIRVGHLEQEPTLEEETVIETLEPALAVTRGMLNEFNEVSEKMTDADADMDALMARMSELQSQLDACGGWELDAKLDQAMEALRCPPRDAKIATLSGGERRRVAICRLLLENPDILLLDEPTNHLDAQSVAWLERYLHDFKGTVVAITHDRYFLDNVAGWILELDQGNGIPFEGNYSAWLESKAKRLESEKGKQAALKRQMKEELDFINQSRGGQLKKGKARLRKYEDLQKQAANYTRDSTLDSIIINPGPRLSGTVVTAQGVCKGYGDRLLLNDAHFNIPPGAVVGVIGPNGAGKTTLFKMVMGYEKPDDGTLTIGDSVVPMYVDQSRDDLDGERTVYEEIADGYDVIDVGGREIMAHQYCSWFNFNGSIKDRQVSTLSGGERNRLQLAKTLRLGGNVLMLDEPSNDLDVDTLRALETAIENFAGTTIVVSHDRWFLDRIATHIIAYEGDSEVRFFSGSYSEYEADRFKRTGVADPTKVKYKPMPEFA